MATKTYKIGECCINGIIKVITTKKTVTISSIDYFSGKEESKVSNEISDSNAESELESFLDYLTTSYYAGKIMEWIKSNVIFPKQSW